MDVLMMAVCQGGPKAHFWVLRQIRHEMQTLTHLPNHSPSTGSSWLLLLSMCLKLLWKQDQRGQHERTLSMNEHMFTRAKRMVLQTAVQCQCHARDVFPSCFFWLSWGARIYGLWNPLAGPLTSQTGHQRFTSGAISFPTWLWNTPNPSLKRMCSRQNQGRVGLQEVEESGGRWNDQMHFWDCRST